MKFYGTATNPVSFCTVCGDQFTKSRSDQLYCSGKCASRSFRGKRRVLIKCVCCGNEFLNFGNKKYCSPECQVAGDRLRRIRNNNGKGKNWSKGKQLVARGYCVVCGKKFYAPPSQRKRGGGKICSNNCKGEMMAKNPTLFPRTSSRRGRGGERPDLDNIYFRSSWEANYARYLNWLKTRGEICSWEYEPECFEFVPIKKGTRFYAPDFRVINKNGSTEYHEVKGYMDDRSRVKINRMARFYPSVKLVLIDKYIYREISSMISEAIPEWEYRR